MRAAGLLSIITITLALVSTQLSAGDLAVSGQGIRLADNSLDPAKIRERAGKIKEMKALLSDPDQTVRLSALDSMLKSDDGPMREVAYEYAFSSPDYAMRAVALRERLRNMKVLIVEPTGAGNRLTLEVLNVDEKTGIMKIRSGDGLVSGLKFSFKASSCEGLFQLDDDAVLKGSVVCTVGSERSLPQATIKLQ